MPSSSLIVNCMVPMPSVSELPAIPLTPTVVDRSIVVNSSNCEYIWCVAQLSVPNSVLVGANEQRLVSNFVVLELARTRTSERSNVSVTRQRGSANIPILLLLLLSRVLGTGESGNGNDADLSLAEDFFGCFGGSLSSSSSESESSCLCSSGGMMLPSSESESSTPGCFGDI